MIIPDDAIELSGNIFAGEYDVKKYNREKPHIIDIGANIGAFARWATYRWPGCSVECYEPIADNYKYLIENTSDNDFITCHNYAVSDNAGKCKMYYGLQNCGQASIYKTEEQISEGEIVNVISASTLEPAHIVKIDTEGSEETIIKNLTFDPELFLVEYHSHAIRDSILEFLDNKFTLIEYSMMNKRSGMIKLVRNDLIWQHKEGQQQ